MASPSFRNFLQTLMGYTAYKAGLVLSLAAVLLLCLMPLVGSFSAATWMRVWQYLPVGFLIVPLTMAGYVGLPPEKANAAAGLMNFMRNIGMSVGTSSVTTLIARRSQIPPVRLSGVYALRSIPGGN